MPIHQHIKDSRVPVKIWTDDIDDKSKQQLANIASMPFVHHHIAAMPDVHLGIGATVCSVIATHKAIIPAAVEVDIGCGMVAARLSLTANDIDEKSLRKVFNQITRYIPVGKAQHKDDRVLVDMVRPFEPGLKAITNRHPQLLKYLGKFSKWANQMGTLGSGNHFIEVCLDEANQVWVMLHSGSRGIGNAIASYFIQLARNDLVAQTTGVICRKDKGVLDEIPGAYKDIDKVMANQKDLTEILHTLKQVVCVKG